MKRNVHKLFEELSTEIYYGLNMKIVMMTMTDDQFDEMEDFIRHCREGRGAGMLPHYHFRELPQLKFNWEEWNSGGGCMIWSHEFCDGTSVHVTDECLILSKFNIENHRNAEFDGEEDHYLMVHHFTEEHESPLSFYLCPFIGQEMADIIEHDVNEIHRCW